MPKLLNHRASIIYQLLFTKFIGFWFVYPLFWLQVFEFVWSIALMATYFLQWMQLKRSNYAHGESFWMHSMRLIPPLLIDNNSITLSISTFVSENPKTGTWQFACVLPPQLTIHLPWFGRSNHLGQSFFYLSVFAINSYWLSQIFAAVNDEFLMFFVLMLSTRNA